MSLKGRQNKTNESLEHHEQNAQDTEPIWVPVMGNSHINPGFV
jgi:hypothetical protein